VILKPTIAGTIWGTIAGLLAMTITIVAAHYVYGVVWTVRDGAVMLAIFLLTIAVHHDATRSAQARKRAGLLLVTAVFVLGLANSILLLFPRQEYGDYIYIVNVVESGNPFSRWMTGTAILGWLHMALWKFPPLAALLPASLKSGHGFICLMSSLCMFVASVALLNRRVTSWAVYVIVTSTVWVVFSLGYLEYYPFIAGLMVLFVIWIFDRPWGDHNPRTLGLLLGLFASFYVGFWPIAGIVAIVFVLADPKRNYPCMAWAVLSFFCCVRIFWPESPANFFVSLWKDMNFGELNTPQLYKGLSSGPASIYFKNSYVFTFAHLRELIYLCFFSGTLVTLCLLTVLIAVRVVKTPWSFAKVTALPSPKVFAAVLLMAYYSRFFLWKIPKLGPRMDFDLFFIFYFLVLFFLGLGLDKYEARTPLTETQWYVFLAFLSGNTLTLCYIIAYKGLPVI
jgi:hypothetical protein